MIGSTPLLHVGQKSLGKIFYVMAVSRDEIGSLCMWIIWENVSVFVIGALLACGVYYVGKLGVLM